jgi:hypothetical protein
MPKYMISILLVLVSLSGVTENNRHANQAIEMTRESIERFLGSSNQLAQLKQKLPQVEQYSDEKAAKTSAEMVAMLQASPIFPEIKSILTSSEFSNLPEFFQFSERLMAIKLFLQLENSKQASVFQTVTILRANLNSMKANKASPQIIQQAEALLKQQEQKAHLIQSSLDKLTEQDKAFANQNQDWLVQLFSR